MPVIVRVLAHPTIQPTEVQRCRGAEWTECPFGIRIWNSCHVSTKLIIMSSSLFVLLTSSIIVMRNIIYDRMSKRIIMIICQEVLLINHFINLADNSLMNERSLMNNCGRIVTESGEQDSKSCAVFSEKGHQILRFVQPLSEEPRDKKPKVIDAEKLYEKLKLSRLCPLEDLVPDKFITSLLHHQGHEYIKKSSIKSNLKRSFEDFELKGYTKDLMTTISDHDTKKLEEICRAGGHVLACNRFGESTLHLAARKSYLDIVCLIFKFEKNPIIIDDYGRSPLHDAMWAIHPNYSIIEILLDHCVDLLHLVDTRGYTPLHYIRDENVVKVCLFLYSRRHKYWPMKNE